MYKYNEKEILIIAHRGASNLAPPNTLKSFQKAIELRADFIEFDVHLSRDEEIVINHDAYISHKDGEKRFIKEMLLEEIKKEDVGEGERIPTLKELVRISKGNIGLQCEVKAPNLSKKLVSLLKQEDLIETSIISSFMLKELLEIQKLESNIKLGLLIPTGIQPSRRLNKYIQKAFDNNFFAIHPHFKSIDEEYVRFIHENELKVNVWTVNEESDMNEVLKMGVDGIISDDVELVKKVLNEN
jgi:glycerophosphoryl diester phosphodiesterase